MVSSQPRKQRKFFFNAPFHKRRKFLSAHLAEDLMIKYNRRSVPIVKGDTVKIMRGEYKGHVEKVSGVDVKKGRVEVEGVTLTKADGKKVPRPIHPSNLLITKLNLTDPWRRKFLERGLPEEVKEEIEREAEEQLKEMEKEEIEEKEVEDEQTSKEAGGA